MIFNWFLRIQTCQLTPVWRNTYAPITSWLHPSDKWNLERSHPVEMYSFSARRQFRLYYFDRKSALWLPNWKYIMKVGIDRRPVCYRWRCFLEKYRENVSKLFVNCKSRQICFVNCKSRQICFGNRFKLCITVALKGYAHQDFI